MLIKFKKVVIFGILTFGIFGSSLALVIAQDGTYTQNPDGTYTQTPKPTQTPIGTKESVKLESPFAFTTVQQLVDKLIDIIIKVGGVLAFFFIIYSGFLFVTAAGSVDQVEKAKATFLWVIVGVAIVLGAKVISVLLQGTVTNIIK